MGSEMGARLETLSYRTLTIWDNFVWPASLGVDSNYRANTWIEILADRIELDADRNFLQTLVRMLNGMLDNELQKPSQTSCFCKGSAA
jgi:hypothetical protein